MEGVAGDPGRVPIGQISGDGGHSVCLQLSQYTDDELREYILQCEHNEDVVARYQALSSLAPLPPVPMSDSLVTKRYDFHYREAADSVAACNLAQSLGVRVPRVYRVIEAQPPSPPPSPDSGDGHWFRRTPGDFVIMERIHGPTLVDIWHQMGWLASLRYAFQLRRYIRLMRTQTSPTAGALTTGLCRSIWLEDDGIGVPLHAPARVLMRIVNWWYNSGFKALLGLLSRSREEDEEACRGPLTMRECAPLVFTHQDLAPRNLMVDSATDRRLVVVDWDYAGYYPPCYEDAGIHHIDDPIMRSKSWTKRDRWRWGIFAWIATGFWSHRQRRVVGIASAGMIRFSFKRTRSVQLGVTLGRRDPNQDSPSKE
ncbi:hypothetical protein GGR56DRAFT_644947 [Xylariaceae sp. FL0804]|nr:hypothetical protein GGR56DRAFT_644947 [Xylariaceae sp. FL0804]